MQRLKAFCLAETLQPFCHAGQQLATSMRALSHTHDFPLSTRALANFDFSPEERVLYLRRR